MENGVLEDAFSLQTGHAQLPWLIEKKQHSKTIRKLSNHLGGIHKFCQDFCSWALQFFVGFELHQKMSSNGICIINYL